MICPVTHAIEATTLLTARTLFGDEAVGEAGKELPLDTIIAISERHPNQFNSIMTETVNL